MNTLKEMFDFFDRNSDGVISRVELIELVEVLLNEKGVGKSSKILKEFDANHDGFIDFEEFIQFSKVHLDIIN